MLRAANDDMPLIGGPLPREVGDLDRLAAWLRIELAEDDTDQIALAADLALVCNMIEQLRPAPRERPRLRCISA